MGAEDVGLSFHPETLEKLQQEVLDSTGPQLTERGFRLAGGTALALVYGHRKSVDFDWFTTESFGDPLRLADELRRAGIEIELDEVGNGTLHGRVRGVRVTLLEYRYPLLDEPIDWPEKKVALLSLDDVACMKLSAIAQRGSRKDFVDVHVLIEEHRPLDALLELYRRKYEVGEIGHVLYALSYFDDAERERMPQMLWPLDWTRIRRSIEQQVRKLDR